MSVPPQWRPGIQLPGAPDPATPTLWVCTDCGAVMFVPNIVVPTIAEVHRRYCIGPRITTICKFLEAHAVEDKPPPPEVTS